jgi:diguanylate cyclase (GGDEF)-like protein/PAS domain S-box-containing protein
MSHLIVSVSLDEEGRVISVCQNWQRLLVEFGASVPERLTDVVTENGGKGKPLLTFSGMHRNIELPIFSTSEIQVNSGSGRFVAFGLDHPVVEPTGRANDALRACRSAILVQGPDWMISGVEGAWEELTQFTRAETIGRDFLDFLHPDDWAQSAAYRPRLKSSRRLRSNVVRMRTKSGNTKTVLLASRIEGDGDAWSNTITISDISKLTPVLKRLSLMAHRDELTRLLSRRGLFVSFADGVRTEDLGVFLVDCDDFKSVNDRYGHVHGDRLLREIAATLTCFSGRPSHAARLGGDELVVLLPCADRAHLTELSDRLSVSLEAISIDVDGTPVSRTVAVGSAFLPLNGELRQAIAEADILMLSSKRQRVAFGRSDRTRE